MVKMPNLGRNDKGILQSGGMNSTMEKTCNFTNIKKADPNKFTGNKRLLTVIFILNG